MEPILVGVAGGSASGKTTVVGRLVDQLAPLSVSVLPHDAYYHDLAHLPPDERAAVNVDHPDSLETDLLVQHVGRLRTGESVEVPSYDFVSQTRGPRGSVVHPSNVLLIEGLFPLADARIRELCDLLVFVVTTSEERLARRTERDGRERGRGPDEVRRQHDERVEPMHARFVEPSRAWAQIEVVGGGQNRAGIALIADRVRALISGSEDVGEGA